MIPSVGTVFAATENDIGVGLAAVIVLGVGIQLIASRLRLPSIVLLLLGGVLAGPVLEIVQPDEMLGELLFPAVSLAVGILLFEGGLGLRVAELGQQGRGPIVRLITIGVIVTWIVGALGAHVLVGLDADPAILLGAILVVSGPTVVLPLVRFARPREPVAGILRWEGIFIDPIGATLAIVVLDAVIGDAGTGFGLRRILTTSAAGTAAGLLGAAVLILLFHRHWVPDHLHNPFTLAVVVAAFAGADLLRPEAGLFATTVMGVALANQRWAPVAHIREFEENLGSLILSGLFIVLGARVDLDELLEFLPGALALSALLIVVARPLAVYVSTVASGLTFVERAYLACMSPRGIVAASVSALFALELEEGGEPVDELVPVTFTVIVVTAIFSAFASRLGASRFRVERPSPLGVAFIGAPHWVIELATWLADHEIPTIVVTTDPLEAAEASSRGVLSYTGKLESEDLVLALEGVGVRTVIATSRFQELNTLGINRAAENVGRANVYFLPRNPDDLADEESSHSAVIARRPFGRSVTQATIEERIERGGRLVAVTRETYDGDRLRDAIPLLTITAEGPTVMTVLPEKAPVAGAKRVYLVDEETWRSLDAPGLDDRDAIEPLPRPSSVESDQGSGGSSAS